MAARSKSRQEKNAKTRNHERFIVDGDETLGVLFSTPNPEYDWPDPIRIRRTSPAAQTENELFRLAFMQNVERWGVTLPEDIESHKSQYKYAEIAQDMIRNHAFVEDNYLMIYCDGSDGLVNSIDILHKYVIKSESKEAIDVFYNVLIEVYVYLYKWGILQKLRRTYRKREDLPDPSKAPDAEINRRHREPQFNLRLDAEFIELLNSAIGESGLGSKAAWIRRAFAQAVLNQGMELPPKFRRYLDDERKPATPSNEGGMG